MKKIITIIFSLLVFLPSGANAEPDGRHSSEIVNIPDSNFKRYLIRNFDRNRDGEISVAEAAIVKKINCPTDNIYSLEGIEYFTSLEELRCCGINSRGKLTSIDVSNNWMLESLICYNNNISEINVSNNKCLLLLSCFNCNLKRIDVSNNMNLMRLYCEENQIEHLNVTNNSKLTELGCGSNRLSKLNVSYNNNLCELYCANNNLTELNVTNNPRLFRFYCYGNRLTTLDVSRNPILTQLQCDEMPSLRTLILNGRAKYSVLQTPHNVRRITQ